MQPKVLLLDDDRLSLEFMRLYLEGEGVEVYTAVSCAEARAAFKKHKPEVVVVDVELQDGSGLDFAKFARDWGVSRVVLASGHSPEHLNDQGLTDPSLLDEILTKPLQLTQLKAAVFAN